MSSELGQLSENVKKEFFDIAYDYRYDDVWRIAFSIQRSLQLRRAKGFQSSLL